MAMRGPEQGLRKTLEPREPQTTPVDLRQQTYDLLAQVREPSTREQKEFEARGFVFLPVEQKTLPQVIEEDPDYFRRGELDYVNEIPGLRDYALPTSMLIAVNPTELFVLDSFNKDRLTQLAMTKAHSTSQIETVNPEARVVMLPATGLAQLDKAYKQKTGRGLFISGRGRALDNTSDVGSATVGRFLPGFPLDVSGLNVQGSDTFCGVVSAIMFTRK